MWVSDFSVASFRSYCASEAKVRPDLDFLTPEKLGEGWARYLEIK